MKSHPYTAVLRIGSRTVEYHCTSEANAEKIIADILEKPEMRKSVAATAVIRKGRS